MPDELESLFRSPERHFMAFQGSQALFVRMNRQSYARSAFLDSRASAIDPSPTAMALKPLLDQTAQKPDLPAPAWIFHMAHCGSTMLSRLVDVPGATLVLREPPPLRQLAVEAEDRRSSERWKDQLRLAVMLAARRFEPAERVIVKANVPVNFILDDVMSFDRAGAAIALHMRFEAHLLAILRTEAHRAWVDQVSAQMAPALEQLAIGSASNTVEAAARLWLAQILLFDNALRTFPGLCSLDAEAFLAHPADTAEAVLRHFGVEQMLSPAALERTLTRNAKDSAVSFDESQRQAREARDRERLTDELKVARRWIEKSPAASRLPDDLARPLSGRSTRLL